VAGGGSQLGSRPCVKFEVKGAVPKVSRQEERDRTLIVFYELPERLMSARQEFGEMMAELGVLTEKIMGAVKGVQGKIGVYQPRTKLGMYMAKLMVFVTSGAWRSERST
jgi:hypothetical protein